MLFILLICLFALYASRRAHKEDVEARSAGIGRWKETKDVVVKGVPRPDPRLREERKLGLVPPAQMMGRAPATGQAEAMVMGSLKKEARPGPLRDMMGARQFRVDRQRRGRGSLPGRDLARGHRTGR